MHAYRDKQIGKVSVPVLTVHNLLSESIWVVFERVVSLGHFIHYSKLIHNNIDIIFPF